MAATKIRQAGDPYSGVYMYMVHGDSLVLEAFDGRPTEHHVIPVGSGLCGKAVAEGHDLNVPDVTESDEYMTCSIETQSELIVLIRTQGNIVGQIDVDSDVRNGFNELEQASVREIADFLGTIL